MRNRSQNAGCMRRWLRSPTGDSHCCHDLMLVCTSAAATDWVIPVASRAARTSSGVGFRARLPTWLRFGWLGITAAEVNERCADLHVCVFGRFGRPKQFHGVHWANRSEIVGGAESGQHIGLASSSERHFEFSEDFICGHGLLQPLITRGAVGKQCASHELNYTRIARNCKDFFELFFGGRGYLAKPSNYVC